MREEHPRQAGGPRGIDTEEISATVEVGLPPPPEGANSVQDRTPEDQADPIWRSQIKVWVKSECLDGEDYLRTGRPEYDGSSWPLGLTLARGSELGGPPDFLLLDSWFDRHVKNALKLPWQCSKLEFAMPRRRYEVNFTVRNVGHWQEDQRHLANVRPVLADRRFDRQLKKSYALTPFCIIGQAYADSEIADNQILMFYTFETFIQECLALEAYNKGVASQAIIDSYQNVYCNASPPEATPNDPAQFGMAKLAAPSIDWDQIITRTPWIDGRNRPDEVVHNLRRFLFFHRLQTHLMVAIAASCHGIAGFERAPSPLVRSTATPPVAQELAPFWLSHMLGGYDYAAECERLLTGLAIRYGHQVSIGERGVDWTNMHPARNDTERSIVATLSTGLEEPNAMAPDFFRWGLFEIGLDDASLQDWREKVRTGKIRTKE